MRKVKRTEATDHWSVTNEERSSAEELGTSEKRPSTPELGTNGAQSGITGAIDQ